MEKPNGPEAMLGVSRASNPKPSAYFYMAVCMQLMGFIVMCVGVFTPFWASIREQIADGPNNNIYDRGLIVSCQDSSFMGCSVTITPADYSGWFQAAYAFAIISLLMGFLILLFLAVATCFRSCRKYSLAVPFAAVTIFVCFSLLCVLIFFEISVTHDVTTGNRYREHTFGLSRIIMIVAIILYMISALLFIGEYFRRRKGSPFRPKRQPAYNKAPQDYRRAAPGYKNKAGPVVVSHPEAYARNKPERPPSYQEKNEPYVVHTDDYDGSSVGMNACRRPGCGICDFVQESFVFWGPAGVFTIKERLNCTDKHVVYAVSCMRDDQVFVGHSTPSLEETFGRHLENIRRGNRGDPVANHFRQHGHSIQDVRVQAIAKLDCDVDTRARLQTTLSYDMDRPLKSYYGINPNFAFIQLP